jgi:hypothetical protein
MIFRTKTPEDKYVEVAMIAELAPNENVGIEKLRRAAAGVGCDGVIVSSTQVETVRSGKPSFDVLDTGERASTVDEVSVSGTCIMFETDNGSWKAPEAGEEPAGPDPRPHCSAGKERIAAERDSVRKHELIRALPSECHQPAPAKD